MGKNGFNFDDLSNTKPKTSTSYKITMLAVWVVVGMVLLYVGYLGMIKFMPQSQKSPEVVATATVPAVQTNATPASVTTPAPAPAVPTTPVVSPAVQPTPQPQTSYPGGMTVCRGPDTGAFVQILRDLNRVCPELQLNGLKTTGAVENMDLLLAGSCDFALGDPDDRARRLQMGGQDAESAKKARTVIGLYDGEVNMVAVNPNLQLYSQFTDSVRFGVSGGAVATFQTIQDLTGVKFPNVTNYATTAQQLTALRKGEIDVIVANGAYKQPWLETVDIPGAHMVRFDRFDRVKDVMFTGPKGGFFGKRTPKYASLGDVPVEVLSTRTVIATTTDGQKSPANQQKAQAIFSCVKRQIYVLQGRDGGTYHESWQRIAPMNDPGGMPWANIINK